MDVREKTTNDKRLIDYDEIRRLFDAQYKETVQLIHDGEAHLDNLAEGFTEADRIIQKIPTVDAVEVVRCRDCKHRGTDYCIFHIKGEPADEELLRKLDNDFCSYGERKDGDGNG